MFNLFFYKSDYEKAFGSPLNPYLKCNFPGCNNAASVMLIDTERINADHRDFRSHYLLAAAKTALQGENSLITCYEHKANLPKENEV